MQPSERKQYHFIKPPGGILLPSPQKRPQIANQLSAAPFYFDSFCRYSLSVYGGQREKLSKVIGSFYIFSQRKLKKPQAYKNFTPPDKKRPNCRGPPFGNLEIFYFQLFGGNRMNKIQPHKIFMKILRNGTRVVLNAIYHLPQSRKKGVSA